MSNNSTLNRKPSNDMIENAGFDRPVRRSDQAGDGEDFAFNGQMGDGVNRAGNRYAGNQAGLSLRENYGMGPRKGNASDSGDERGIGKSATKDAQKMTIATASQGMNIGKETRARKFPNPDAINVGNK